ncbi:MAG: MCE family protein, partial [Mycobacterium sp.]
GRVSQTESGDGGATLSLNIYRDQARFIPANVGAQIRATTAFGGKYVDLVYPTHPVPQRLRAGAVIKTSNIVSEVNTVFENLVAVLKNTDPVKLNAVLSAFAEALRGQGQTIGEATTAANEVLLALNPRAHAVRRDWQALRRFSDTYNVAAQNIITTLDAASTLSATITNNTANLDQLLLNVIGLSRSGINVLGPNKDNLITAVNSLQPTTSLLMKYNPALTCMLVGAKWHLDNGGYSSTGGNGRSVILDAGLDFGDDLYRYPDNLPIVGAKGGPGGKPGCGALPFVDKNFPVRELITNTGFGTGLDWRPNPGIGFPGWANYFPVTRGVPEPPSIRYRGGPAPGPVPYPGAPPYGAPQYAPDGTPLYPGLPPGIPANTPPPDPAHVPPGAEPPAQAPPP